MSVVARFGIAIAFLVACGTAKTSAALTLEELQRLLQATRSTAVSYAELRESPWLTTPVESRGTLHSLPDSLEKRVETPRPETWRILADRLEWVGPDGSRGKSILFSKVPAVGVLADALRRAVAGDLGALERDFRIELQGDRQAWAAQLLPLRAETSRYLDHLRLEGSDGRLRTITIVERKGDRTTTHLFP
jgi:hypothetical protein